eukprot:364033-Chlamydomonas_euryale.AAC.17
MPPAHAQTATACIRTGRPRQFLCGTLVEKQSSNPGVAAGSRQATWGRPVCVGVRSKQSSRQQRLRLLPVVDVGVGLGTQARTPRKFGPVR